jgi:hypothetical protein
MSDYGDFSFKLKPKSDFGFRPDFEYKGIKLVMTSMACPEQYDAYDGTGAKIGYFRLRHGGFRVEHLPTDRIVYSTNPKGDGLFEPEEREHYLKQGIRELKFAHKEYCRGRV